jgi:hypothetical protein
LKTVDPLFKIKASCEHGAGKRGGHHCGDLFESDVHELLSPDRRFGRACFYRIFSHPVPLPDGMNDCSGTEWGFSILQHLNELSLSRRENSSWA